MLFLRRSSFLPIFFGMMIFFTGCQKADSPVSEEKAAVTEITYKVWRAYGRPSGIFGVFEDFPYTLLDVASEVLFNDELPYIGTLSKFVKDYAEKVREEASHNFDYWWGSDCCWSKTTVIVFVLSNVLVSMILCLLCFEAGRAVAVFFPTTRVFKDEIGEID